MTELTDDELLALAQGMEGGCICPIHCDPDTIKRLIQRSKRLEEAERELRTLRIKIIASLGLTEALLAERV